MCVTEVLPGFIDLNTFSETESQMYDTLGVVKNTSINKKYITFSEYKINTKYSNYYFKALEEYERRVRENDTRVYE